MTIKLDPAVAQTQRVTLLLNELSPPSNRPPYAYRFAAPPPSPQAEPPVAERIAIPIADVVPGDYLARVQVDGAESPLDVDETGAFSGPKVSIQ